MRKIQNTPFFSKCLGSIARGCRLCVRGEKSVLFVTGLCSCRCFFCPISEKKHQKDVVYINEWPTDKISDMITETKMCGSKGAGITGGDPLVRIERTIIMIKALKKRFGKEFHIHLYTPLKLVTKDKLTRLHKAGLDEIRFHPQLDDSTNWNRIELALGFSWDVGVEIPVIPGMEKQTKELISFICGKVKFLNLNELEISDTNAQHLTDRGFKTKDSISYAVKGSDAMAKRLLRFCADKRIFVHYCTTRLKDGVQLRNRIKRRAKNAAKKYDIITEEGMLFRAALYAKEKDADLPAIRKKLMKKLEIPPLFISVDKPRFRILTSPVVAEAFLAQIKAEGLIPALVEEYPTWDCLNVETIFL